MIQRTVPMQAPPASSEPDERCDRPVDETHAFAFCQGGTWTAPVPVRDLIGPFIQHVLEQHLEALRRPSDPASVRALEADPVECAVIFARAAERMCGETYPSGTMQTLYKAHLAIAEMYKCRARSGAGQKRIDGSDIDHHRRCAWTYVHTLACANFEPDIEIALLQATLRLMMTGRKAADPRPTAKRKPPTKLRATTSSLDDCPIEKEWRKMMREAGIYSC